MKQYDEAILQALELFNKALKSAKKPKNQKALSDLSEQDGTDQRMAT